MDLSSPIKHPKNTVIIKEGSIKPYSMYIILSGSARVVKDYGKSEQKIVGTLGAGDLFGETSLLMSKPRNATVVTKEETLVLEITQENFFEFNKNNPQLILGILKTLCVRIETLNEKVRLATFNYL